MPVQYNISRTESPLIIDDFYITLHHCERDILCTRARRTDKALQLQGVVQLPSSTWSSCITSVWCEVQFSNTYIYLSFYVAVPAPE